MNSSNFENRKGKTRMCSTEYFPGNTVLQTAKTEKQFQHNSGEKQNHRYFKDNILQGIMKRK